MTVPLSVVFILLVISSGFVLCGFTYDDAYEEIDKDNYGMDISELSHITAEQPKYNTIIRGYRGPEFPNEENFAIPDDVCDVDKYVKYLEPFHKIKTDRTADERQRQPEMDTLTDNFMALFKKKEFTWKEVCYHRLNSLYCKEGKCACLEVPSTKYFGLKPAKKVSFDPLNLKRYHFCVIQEGYGCNPLHSNLLPNVPCDEKLYCSKDNRICEKSVGSSLSPSFWATVLTFIYFKIYFMLID